MPTVIELGQRVKAKYPEYRDMPDIEVGRKVKARYPNDYGDFTDVSEGGVMDAALGAAKGAIVNPIAGAAQVIGAAFQDPMGTVKNVAKGIYEGHANEFRQAGEAMRQGDYMSAAGHALYGAMPVVGPAMSQGMATATDPNKTMFERGEAVGEVISNVLPVVPGAGKVKATVAKIGNKRNAPQVDFARSRDIPLSAADVSDNAFIRHAQQLSGAASMTGGSIAAGAREAKAGAIRRTMGELADETGAPSMTPYTAGQRLGQSLEKKAKTFADEAEAAYGELADIEKLPQVQRDIKVGERVVTSYSDEVDEFGAVGRTQAKVPVTKKMPMPVDVRPLKQMAEPILNDLRQLYKRRDSKARMAMDDQIAQLTSIVEGPDFKPARLAELDLSGMKAYARNADPTQATVTNANALMQMQKQIDDTVATIGGPQAIRALQRGRARWATKADIEETLMKLREEPVNAFGQTIYKNDSGVDYLKRLRDHAPDQMPELGRAYLEDMFEKSMADGGVGHATRMKSAWGNLGKQTKEILFPNPAHRKDLDTFFRFVERQGDVLNTSRTTDAAVAAQQLARAGAAGAGFLGAGADGAIGVLLAAELGGAALAKAMYSPKFVAKLTEGYKLPVGSAAQKLAIANLLDMARRQGEGVQ